MSRIFVTNFRGMRSEMFAIYNSAWPVHLESNTIFWLSGDQRGVPVRGSLKFEICIRWVPSASLIQTSRNPPRVDSKAMCLPSGEYPAVVCSRVEDSNLVEEACEFSRSLRQTSTRSTPVANASLSPLVKIAGQAALTKGSLRTEPSASVN